MKDKRSYHFISTYKDNIFLPAPAIREIESYQTTNPALWQIFGKGEFAIVEGLVFPKENWDIIEDDAFPTWLGEEIIGIDWGFTNDPTTFVGVIINGEDIYARELHYQMGMKTKDIAEALEPYSGNYKYCDIDNRLVTELEDAGIPLLTMTKKNSESIMSGIRLMNQRRIHVTNSSNDLIKELKNYVYKKDRHDTYQTNLRPIDKFNHCIDALRYVVYAECGGINNAESSERELSKEDLGIFM
jgi:phage terminase large subunit